MKYADCEALYAKKRGKARSLRSYLYMSKIEEDGEIRYVVHTSVDRESYFTDYFTVGPGDIVRIYLDRGGVIHRSIRPQSLQTVLNRYYSICVWGKTNKRKSNQIWVAGANNTQGEVAFVEGMRYDLNTGLFLDEGAKAKTRLINKDRAKQLKEKLEQWRKVLQTTGLMFKGDYATTYVDCEAKFGMKRWELNAGNFYWPKAEDAIDGNKAMLMLAWADIRTQEKEWKPTLSANGQQTGYTQVEKETYFKNLIGKIMTKLREDWYAANGVFEWVEALPEAA